jgi:hypothetical protein
MPNWADEPTAELTPVHTAFLTRDREQVWIHSYAEPAMVVLTYPSVELDEHPQGEMPGLVRELHVRPRDPKALSGKFTNELLRHIGEGWDRRDAERVWSADPWETPSVLDEPATF